MIQEIKRIIKDSEIMKYAHSRHVDLLRVMANVRYREDDTKWPQKNKDGRQELEIRLGSEHISFEVYRHLLNDSTIKTDSANSSLACRPQR